MNTKVPFVPTFHCVDCFIFHLYTKPILNRRSISYIPLRNLRFLFRSILYFIMGLRKAGTSGIETKFPFYRKWKGEKSIIGMYGFGVECELRT